MHASRSTATTSGTPAGHHRGTLREPRPDRAGLAGRAGPVARAVRLGRDAGRGGRGGDRARGDRDDRRGGRSASTRRRRRSRRSCSTATSTASTAPARTTASRLGPRSADEVRRRARLRHRIGRARPRRPGDRRGARDRGPRVRATASSTARLPAPDDDVVLEPDWALQDPDDYVATIQATVPRRPRGQRASTRPTSSGSGIDFTACTMLPTTADGTPLCRLPELRREPHAWVKLWKHHAAQPEADRINETAAARGEPWLPRYGGRISSEWFFSKAPPDPRRGAAGLPAPRTA